LVAVTLGFLAILAVVDGIFGQGLFYGDKECVMSVFDLVGVCTVFSLYAV
jgi:hypothetical protein